MKEFSGNCTVCALQQALTWYETTGKFQGKSLSLWEFYPGCL